MLPSFPTFKKLELSDKEEIDTHTGQFPPYSDFEFASLWSWDVKEEMGVSVLYDNLVVKFTDYTTGEPFLTFLGTKSVNETATELLAYSLVTYGQDTLNLIPEVSSVALDPNVFHVEESRDHFDYICDVERHLEYQGNELKSHRKLLRQFSEAYPDFESVSLDLTSQVVQGAVADLFRSWNESKGFIMTSEAFAYERMLSGASSLSLSAVGIRFDGKIIAFHVVSLPPGTCANALFSKADAAYRGIYPTLDHVVARDLLKHDYTHMNIQQDLGIENLRKAKQALHPVYLLKKFDVRLRTKT